MNPELEKQKLLERIKSVNSLTSQDRVRELKEIVSWKNCFDPANKEIFEAADKYL